MQYSLAIVRSVNGLVDGSQQGILSSVYCCCYSDSRDYRIYVRDQKIGFFYISVILQRDNSISFMMLCAGLPVIFEILMLQ